MNEEKAPRAEDKVRRKESKKKSVIQSLLNSSVFFIIQVDE